MSETYSKALLDTVRNLPHRPGVYLFKDRLGRVLYVGKARDLHKRVSQYFHPSRQYGADRKTLALLRLVVELETHTVKSDPEALLLEGKLIKEYRPRFNVSFRDDKKFLLVRVHLGDPFPRFQLTRIRKDDGARYFGPFPHSSALRKTLKLMHERFHVRTCRPVIPTEDDFKHCLDHIIKNCSAPCTGRILRDAYMQQVQAACEFLSGQSEAMAAEIESEMRASAENLDFEKAARLRDMLDDLKQTTKPVKRFVREFHRVTESRPGLTELQTALELPSLPAVMECFDISNISTAHVVASMVAFRNGLPDKSHYRRYRIRGVEGQNDFAAMAEVVRRRYRRVLGEQIRKPNLIIVDGGKGQLSAAKTELNLLGLDTIPIIGLAKENEEIYRVGNPEPLILSRDSDALKLLQRIRDEAHRFANEYHQLLLKRRIQESVLDDCPGVSQARKQQLLQHFGSVQRLRHASVEKIAELPGIGRKLAENIHAFLIYRADRSSESIASTNS